MHNEKDSRKEKNFLRPIFAFSMNCQVHVILQALRMTGSNLKLISALMFIMNNQLQQKLTVENMHFVLFGKLKHKGGNSSKVPHDQFKNLQTFSPVN